MLQGVIQAALGIGAFLSNFLAGFVVKAFGFNTGFLGLAAIALAGTLVFAIFMPETLNYEPIWASPSPGKKITIPGKLSPPVVI